MAGATTTTRPASARPLNWAWAWPANRRILYNRASCDLSGKPFDPTRKLIGWNGTAWTGADVPDFKADEPPENGMGPFIMNPEGVARFFARDEMNEGPFPEHYEPFETPLGYNPLHPQNAQATNNPAARVFPDDRAAFGKAADFPHTCDDLSFDRALPLLDQACAAEFDHSAAAVRRNWRRPGEGGGRRGGRPREGIVESRLSHCRSGGDQAHQAMMIDGKKVQTVGVPLHWGFKGQTKPGYIANTLTPVVGDANSQTPEFKSFLVKVEKA
jgi:formate dehydrogenase major subunit